MIFIEASHKYTYQSWHLFCFSIHCYHRSELWKTAHTAASTTTYVASWKLVAAAAAAALATAADHAHKRRKHFHSHHSFNHLLHQYLDGVVFNIYIGTSLVLFWFRIYQFYYCKGSIYLNKGNIKDWFSIFPPLLSRQLFFRT